MKIFFLVFIFTCSLFGFSISSYTVANGKTALVEFKEQDGVSYKSIKYAKKSYKIFQNPKDEQKFYALLPINYYTKPKEIKVEIEYTLNNNLKTTIMILQVLDGDYKKETIHVDSKRVTLNKEDSKRALKEYGEASKIYNTITKKSYIQENFIVPLDSKITSDFGKARVYNGTLKTYHSGTDFRAPEGTEIVATNDGIIVLAKDRFYSGNSVIIDHGHGIYTCYYHLSEFRVKKGDLVKKGEVLGLSGSTGRVTGPHLHLSARVGGVQVDPLQLIKLLNHNLLK